MPSAYVRPFVIVVCGFDERFKYSVTFRWRASARPLGSSGERRVRPGIRETLRSVEARARAAEFAAFEKLRCYANTDRPPLAIAIAWALLFIASLTYSAWCRPLSPVCLESVPIWTISGLFLFGIPTFLFEALIAAAVSIATVRMNIATIVMWSAIAGLTLAQFWIGSMLGPTVGTTHRYERLSAGSVAGES
jgi:hypothetical protein